MKRCSRHSRGFSGDEQLNDGSVFISRKVYFTLTFHFVQNLMQLPDWLTEVLFTFCSAEAQKHENISRLYICSLKILKTDTTGSLNIFVFDECEVEVCWFRKDSDSLVSMCKILLKVRAGLIHRLFWTTRHAFRKGTLILLTSSFLFVVSHVLGSFPLWNLHNKIVWVLQQLSALHWHLVARVYLP